MPHQAHPVVDVPHVLLHVRRRGVENGVRLPGVHVLEAVRAADFYARQLTENHEGHSHMNSLLFGDEVVLCRKFSCVTRFRCLRWLTASGSTPTTSRYTRSNIGHQVTVEFPCYRRASAEHYWSLLPNTYLRYEAAKYDKDPSNFDEENEQTTKYWFVIIQLQNDTN